MWKEGDSPEVDSFSEGLMPRRVLRAMFAFRYPVLKKRGSRVQISPAYTPAVGKTAKNR